MRVSSRTPWFLMSLSAVLIAGCGTASSQAQTPLTFIHVHLTGHHLPHHAKVRAFLTMTLVNQASHPMTFNVAHLQLQQGQQVYHPVTSSSSAHSLPTRKGTVTGSHRGLTVTVQPGHHFFWDGMVFLLPQRLCGSTLSGHVGHLPGTMQARLSCPP